MVRLFYLLNLRSLWGQKLQSLICVVGVMLGVGMIVSIDLANQTALGSFRAAVEAVAGKTATSVVARSPATLGDEVYPQVALMPGVRAATPVIDQFAACAEAGGGPLHVLGIDPLSDGAFHSAGRKSPDMAEGTLRALLTDPRAILINDVLAGRFKLRTGDRLHLVIDAVPVELHVCGTFELDPLARDTADNLALVDVATAQELFHKVGSIDRIDLILRSTTPEAIGAIEAALPEGTELERPGDRVQTVERMAASYHLNLTALSYMGLLVGVLIVFNSMSYAVLRRRGLLGVVRSLGMTRRELAAMFLVEAVVLATIGGVAGVLLGRWWAEFSTAWVTRTISDFYGYLRPGRLPPLGDLPWCEGLVVAWVATLAGAAIPTYEACTTPPLQALNRATLDRTVRRWAGAVLGLGVLLLAGAAGVLLLPGDDPRAGFAAALLVVLGGALMTPAGVRVASALLGRAVRPIWPGLGVLACRNVSAGLSTSGVAVASLMAALAMAISVSVMIASFRQTVEQWMTQRLSADLYLSPVRSGGQRGALPPELVREVARDPAVADLDRVRTVKARYQGRTITLKAVTVATLGRHAGRFFRPGTGRDIYERLERGAVAVSEPLAHHARLGPGSTMTLHTCRGPVTFLVAGVFYDYTSDAGVVLLDRRTYETHWADPAISDLAIYLTPGASPEAVRRAWQEQHRFGSRFAVQIVDHRQLRTEVLRIFDRTFRITLWMRSLANAVAFCGVLGALVALLWNRLRDLGVLRSLGTTFGQIIVLVGIETMILVGVASLLACGAGLVLAWILAFIINLRSFGWSTGLSWHPEVLVQTTALACAAGLAACALPLWWIARTDPLSVLRGE